MKIYLFLISFLIFVVSCQNHKVPHQSSDKLHQKLQREAIETLRKYDKENYIDSAYWYFYVYFGSSKIKQCGAADVDAILPESRKRRIITHDVVLTNVRIIPDSSLLFLSVTPLVKDSILSCDMVEGQQLPHELMFNFAINQFIQFVYDENSWLRIKNIDPVSDYNAGLRKIIEQNNLDPHPKFMKLLNKMLSP